MTNRKTGAALLACALVLVTGSRQARADEREAEAYQEDDNGGELTGSAADAATAAGTACRSACAVSYAALCLRVQQICAAATTVTIGSAAIPCATAIATTCLGSAALAVVCADRCPI